MRFLPSLLTAAAAGILAALSTPASALLILIPDDPQAAPLPVARQEINTTVTGRAARTVYKTTFRNPHNRIMEGTFVTTVPEDAQVSDFAVTIGGQTLRGEVLPRDEARTIYENIVRRTKDPGLLEHLEGRTMRLRVFPIPANGEAEVELEYLQTLTTENGMVRYQIDQTFPEGTQPEQPPALTVKIENEGGVGLLQSPTHEIATAKKSDSATVTLGEKQMLNGQFVLYFDDASAEVGMHLLASKTPGEDGGSFLLFIDPPEEGAMAKPVPKDVIFVLDESGSMADDGKMEKAQAALVQCLQALNRNDRFALVAFSTGMDAFRPEFQLASDENLKDAQEWLMARRARGGTNIHGALEQALGLVRDTKEPAALQQVLFFTDGMPTAGKTDPAQIMALLPEKSEASLRVFPVGFGYDVNTVLLDGMAKRGRSFTEYIHPEEDLEMTITSLFRAISHPVLTNLKLDFGGVEVTETFPPELPDLFLGREVIVAGSYDGSGAVTVTLTGKAADEEYELKADASLPKSTNKDNEFVRAIWANRKVAYLLDEIRRNGETKELREEVTELAMQHNLVTPYTSFLAAPDEEYRIVNAFDTNMMGGTMPFSAPGSAPAPNRGARLQMHEQALDGAVLRRRQDSFQSARSVGSAAPQEALAAASSAPSGQRAVQAADAIQMQMQSSHAPQVQGKAQLDQRFVGARQFLINEDGFWVEKGFAEGTEVREVKYLSDEYFALIAAHPEERGAITIGEKVILKLGEQWVRIE